MYLTVCISFTQRQDPKYEISFFVRKTHKVGCKIGIIIQFDFRFQIHVVPIHVLNCVYWIGMKAIRAPVPWIRNWTPINIPVEVNLSFRKNFWIFELFGTCVAMPNFKTLMLTLSLRSINIISDEKKKQHLLIIAGNTFINYYHELLGKPKVTTSIFSNHITEAIYDQLTGMMRLLFYT